MVKLAMWINKPRLLMLLLIVCIAFLVLYPLLYPKTLVYLYMEQPEGRTLAYRVNVRGRVTVLWEEGKEIGSRTVRLPKEALNQLTALADNPGTLTWPRAEN